MTEDEWKLLVVVLILGLLCLIAVGLGLRLVVQNAVDSIVSSASHKQLLLDAENMRLGRPLRAIRGDRTSTNRKLLAALNRI